MNPASGPDCRSREAQRKKPPYVGLVHGPDRRFDRNDGRSVQNFLDLSISEGFGGVQALRDVDLSLDAGEVHCIVGENGSGKSTLIKIISGVHAPGAGRAHHDRGARIRPSLDPSQVDVPAASR